MDSSYPSFKCHFSVIDQHVLYQNKSCWFFIFWNIKLCSLQFEWNNELLNWWLYITLEGYPLWYGMSTFDHSYKKSFIFSEYYTCKRAKARIMKKKNSSIIRKAQTLGTISTINHWIVSLFILLIYKLMCS